MVLLNIEADLYKITSHGEEYRGSPVGFTRSGGLIAGDESSSAMCVTSTILWGYFEQDNIFLKTTKSLYVIRSFKNIC